MSDNFSLKCVNPHFENVWNGTKTFEIRFDLDRDFKVGQTWKLKEFNPETKSFTGRYVDFEILHILSSKDFPEGLKENYSILSISVRGKGKND